MAVGRPGVDREKIREVIAELEREGQVVTVRAVRERVGGSNSTILAEIHSWRAELAERQKIEGEQRVLPALPETLNDRLRAMVAEVWREAMEAAEAENRLLRQQLAESARRYGQLESQTREEIEAVLDEIRTLRSERETLQDTLVGVMSELREHEIRLREEQARNQVLSELLHALKPAAAPKETASEAAAQEAAVPETAPKEAAPEAAAQEAPGRQQKKTKKKGAADSEKQEASDPEKQHAVSSALNVSSTNKTIRQPNEEQQEVVNAVASGKEIVVINALAGTGKTLTLEFVANKVGNKTRVHYIVFNSRNAQEARSRMPKNVQSMTAHSLAYHSLHPNAQESMKSFFGGVCTSIYPQVKEIMKTQNHRDVCAVSATISNFCHSADSVIDEKHLPAPVQARKDKAEMDMCVLSAREIFNTLAYTRGKEVSHDIYLKLCALFPPTLSSDLVLVDESQDLNPCILCIVEHQIKQGKQVVLVGDTYQHIYSFVGAIDAMQYVREKYSNAIRFHLTGSYRFGPEIAEVANCILKMMGCSESLRGLGEKGVVDDQLGYPRSNGAIIYRKNISMINDILSFASAGKKIQIIGGTSELKSLLIAVSDLYHGKKTIHKEVGLFVNYDEFKAFSETDAGKHFLPIIKYVEEQNGDVNKAVSALDFVSNNSPQKGEEYITLSTAHKSKGLQFSSVALCDDMLSLFFSENKATKPSFEELALTYVAVTRAQESLHTDGLLDLLEEFQGFSLPRLQGILRKERKRSGFPGLEWGFMERPGPVFPE